VKKLSVLARGETAFPLVFFYAPEIVSFSDNAASRVQVFLFSFVFSLFCFFPLFRFVLAYAAFFFFLILKGHFGVKPSNWHRAIV